MICLRKEVKVSLWVVKVPSPTACNTRLRTECPGAPFVLGGSLGSFFLVEAEVMFWAGRGMFRWGLLEALRLLLFCGAGETSRLAAFCTGPLYSAIIQGSLLSVKGIGLEEVTPLTEHWTLLAPDSNPYHSVTTGI